MLQTAAARQRLADEKFISGRHYFFFHHCVLIGFIEIKPMIIKKQQKIKKNLAGGAGITAGPG
jgi:hypothetical protein